MPALDSSQAASMVSASGAGTACRPALISSDSASDISSPAPPAFSGTSAEV